MVQTDRLKLQHVAHTIVWCTRIIRQPFYACSDTYDSALQADQFEGGMTKRRQSA